VSQEKTSSNTADSDPVAEFHDARWRPVHPDGPVCGYKLRGKVCCKRGAHYCEPRADRTVFFFSEHLRHVKGPLRRTPFVLRPWQEHEIIRPLFGEVVWSNEWGRYVRRYRRAFLIMSRKNGKSEIAAGILLYLLVGDGEESAEVYTAAKDKDQAQKIFGPARRMVELSPVLRKRLQHIKNAMRLVDAKTDSVLTVITADADGELGHNPHGFCLDELLSQPDGSLWDAMDTADGARLQELLFVATTETNLPLSFGAAMIDEAERIQEDPSRSPHTFVFCRKMPANQDQLDRLHRLFADHPDLPVSLDYWDERNWKWPNPALGEFLSLESMRRSALGAKKSKRAESAFKQFKLNMREANAMRWIALDLWNANAGEVAEIPEDLVPRLEGKRCWAGLDLSSKLDLTAWCLRFEDGELLWRFWVPESMVDVLDKHTDDKFGEWCDAGWVTVTEGDTIDYQRIYEDIARDNERYVIVSGTYDKWSGEPVRQAVQELTGLDMVESNTTYERMTPPMKEAMRKLKAGEYSHHGNPVAAWMADCLEAKHPTDDPERIRPVKPMRDTSHKRIDGMPALFFAEDGAMRGGDGRSVYEERGLSSLG
jgi:phage terminase large subunit-like protein